MLASPAMAVFKCNDCGNLHGARVDNCGMCGSLAVVLLDERTPKTMPPSAGEGEPPHLPPPDQFFAELKPLFEKAFAYVRERDQDREDRLRALDAAEDERRELKATAVVELCSALTDLARAGVDFLRQNAPTKRDPATPVVD